VAGDAVSVVIPCWRCRETIGRAVASVAAQTEPPREVFLVDDASGDGTLERLHELAATHRPGLFHVIALTHNGGPGPARNAGFEAASGELVAFLDADDAWFPDKLRVQSGWMAAHPEAALTGHPTRVLRAGEPLPSIPATFAARRITLNDMLRSNRFPTRSVMLRRALPFRFGGRSVSEDYLLWLEVVASGAACYRLEAVMAGSFREEFDPGGYSGTLWRHERLELHALAALRRKGGISAAALAAASAWSLAKFVRRVLIVRSGTRAAGRKALPR
jgi:cellulose synthase/poly-beta-1,6-N-acetylglucosamine synthase-like glycosyltransferase